MPDVELDSVSIHYETAGDGPLAYVYCHGLGDSGERFEREDMDWYARHFRVVSWDQRGLGRSGQARKYSLPLYASDLNALLDHLGIERAVVFGVSWGGYVVQRFALDYPERCAALVIDSSSSEVNTAGAEFWYLRGEAARLGPEGVAGREPGAAFAGQQSVTEAATISEVRPEHLDSFVAQARAIAGTREHPLTPYLHRIQCPALVVGGGKDMLAGTGGSVIIGRHIPRARTEVLPDAGHGVYMTARAEFRALLLDFLAAHDLHHE